MIAKIEESYEEELAKVRQELQATSSQITSFREQLVTLSSSAPTSSPPPPPPHFSPEQSHRNHFIPPPSPQLDPPYSPILMNDSANFPSSHLSTSELTAPVYDNQMLNYTTNNNSFNNTTGNFPSNKSFGTTSFNQAIKTPLHATAPLPKSQLPLRNPSSTMPSPRSKPRASPAQAHASPAITNHAYASPAHAVDALVLETKEKFALSNIVVPMEKVGDCVYKLGPRKLHLSVVKNRLVVRTSAGGYEDFIHFLAKMDTSSFRHLARD